MAAPRSSSAAAKAGTVALISSFHPSFLDFEHGIRVGHLEPSQRITQVLKHILVERHGVDMVCDRWGRGVYWQWICWVPKPNREAKPLSAGYNFGSAKFFITLDRDARILKSGLQIERAPAEAGAGEGSVFMQKDWDWHTLSRALRTKRFDESLRALFEDGFHVCAGPFSEMDEYTEENWDLKRCLKAMKLREASEWGGFQVFWPTPESELRLMKGHEIIEAIAAVFDEVVPLMQLCMYHPCLRSTDAAMSRR